MKQTAWILFVLLCVFIVLPILLIFKESVIGKRPLTQGEYKQLIQEALEKIPEEKKKEWFDGWVDQLPDEKKLEVYQRSLATTLKQESSAFQGSSLKEFEEQVQKLSQADQDKFRQALTIEVFNEKHAAFAFKAKPFVDASLFENLKAGFKKGWSWEHYRKFLDTPYLYGSLIRSFNVSIFSTLFTVILAYLFAYTINRTTCRFKPYFNAMALLPLVSPPVIMAFALVLLFGRRGLITKVLLEDTLHLINAQSFNLYGMHGIILSQIFTFLPVAFVILHSMLANLDTRVEEAAENLGASRWYTFRRVILPMSSPGLFQSMLVVFILAMQDFGNPRIIGSEYTMVAGVMYDQMIGFQNSNMASVLGVMLLIPSICAYFVGNFWLSKKSFVSKEPTGISYIKETPKVTRRALEVFCFLISTSILLLYVTIISGSFVSVWGVDNTLTLKYYTPAGVSGASFMERDVGGNFGLPLALDSIKMMGFAAVVGGFLAIVAAYVIERRKVTLSKVTGLFVLIPGALPGVVFGIGYIIAFNAPFGQASLALTGTSWIIILLILFTRMYGGFLSTSSVLQKTDYSVEEAAISLGASRFYTFRRVVFPVLKRPWLLGTLFIFVSGLCALGGVIFLISARHQLVSVAIYLFTEQGKFGIACALSTYLIVIVLIVMGLMRFIEKRDKYARIMTSIKQ
jgi:iron(III) transport system permease protein